MTVNLKPMPGNVFIDPEEHSPAQSDIIVIPDKIKGRDMPSFGKVVAMNGVYLTRKGVRVEPDFKVGDRVFFPKFTGTWTRIGDRELIMVKMHDIAGVME